MINFAKGHPEARLLPSQAMAEAARRMSETLLSPPVDASSAMAEETTAVRGSLQYGAGAGGEVYRQRLADFITRQSRLTPFAPEAARGDCLMTTNGVSHGLDLIASTLAAPGDEIIMETPCYFLAADIFRSHRLSVVPMPVSDAGAAFSPTLLDSTLSNHPRARLVYLVPR